MKWRAPPPSKSTMISISKEAKVGLLGVITLTIFYLGFNFLKGLDVFSSENDYVVYYDDIAGLQTSNPVTLQGVTVGRVMGIEVDQMAKRVKVLLAINKKIQISDQSRALLADDGLLGSKLIKLDARPGTPLVDGGEIKAGIEVGLLGSATAQLAPTLAKVDSLLSTLHVVSAGFQATGPLVNDVLISAKGSTQQLTGLMAQNSGNLAKTTQQAALLTANLNALTQSLDAQMKPLLAKSLTIADSVSQLPLGATLKQIDQTVATIQHVLASLEKGQGTAGKVLKDEKLYRNLDKTTANLAALLEDMKANPKRYVHFSLFGRKGIPAPITPTDTLQ